MIGDVKNMEMKTTMGQRLMFQPSPLPSNYGTISKIYKMVSQCTPLPIQQSIMRIHEKCAFTPSKKFFLHHSSQIHRFDEKQFKTYCDLTFHVDGGANCCSIKNKSLFYFFVDCSGEITTVAGTKATSQGWGAVLLKIGNDVTLVGPIYYFPQHPQNTLSPSVLMNYNSFFDATVRTNRCLVTTKKEDSPLVSTPFQVYNDLDFATFEIMCLDPIPNQIIAASTTNNTVLRRSKRIASRSKDSIQQVRNTEIVDPHLNRAPIVHESMTNDKKQFFFVSSNSAYHNNVKGLASKTRPQVISRSTFDKIVEYTIQLTSPYSPRESAIQSFNTILGTNLRSSEATYPSQALKLQNRSMHPSNHEILMPIIANFSRATIRSLTPHQHWILLHLGTMHTSASSLEPLIKNELLSDLPPALKEISSFDCTCWICNMRKANKIPRGKLVDCTPLAPFQRIHVDFSFFTVTSIRGFTSALDVACASTSYPFGFPTKSKSPPIEILRWIIGTLRSMGYVVNFVRVDEGGELANSSSFAEFIFKSDCVLESTGAGNSTNNGKVERQNRTKADMIRAALSTLGIMIKDDLPEDLSIESFWCLAYTHSNFVKRRMYHRMKQSTPHFLISNKKPSARELVPLGSFMTVVHPNKQLLPKLSPNRATRVYFMGYSNHTKIRLYWDKNHPYMIKRSSNCIIEDVPTMHKLEKCFSSSFLNTDEKTRNCHKDITDNIVTTEMFDVADCPFETDNICKVKIVLPPINVSIGFILKSDLVVGLPIIQSTVFNSAAYHHLQPGQRSNMYLLTIDGHDQLSAQAAAVFMKDVQDQKHKFMTIEIVKRDNSDNTTSLVSHRSIFDQVPALIPTNPVIASAVYRRPSTLTEFVTSASKPPTPKSFFEALKTPYRDNWKAAAWKHFCSNKKIVAFSKPFRRSEVPPDDKIFRSLLVLEIKPTDVPGVWQFKVRHAIVGTPQQ